jgi:hypothetical protein
MLGADRPTYVRTRGSSGEAQAEYRCHCGARPSRRRTAAADRASSALPTLGRTNGCVGWAILRACNSKDGTRLPHTSA